MSDSGQRGKKASVNGFAHEHITVGILMKRYQNVSLVDLPHSPYDIIIVRRDEESGKENIIRVQVKTAQKSVQFTGGTRGGVDREYKSGVKKYRQSTETSDVIIGIHPENDSFDLYFVPTVLVEQLDQDSISLTKISSMKNNYEILEKCKDNDFILEKAREYGIIR